MNLSIKLYYEWGRNELTNNPDILKFIKIKNLSVLKYIYI